MGVVLVSRQGYVIPRVFSLSEPCNNNVAEYNALLIGIKIAGDLGIRYIKAYGDSLLIINQVHGEFEVRHIELDTLSCRRHPDDLGFKSFHLEHISRRQNAYADALASFGTSLAI